MAKQIKMLYTQTGKYLFDKIHTKFENSLCKFTLNYFANSEINIVLHESVRDRDIYIFSCACSIGNKSINDTIMETIFLISACIRNNAHRVTLIIPYLPYSRSDKKDYRGEICSKTIINLFTTAGVNRIVTMDLHSGQIQAFADIPFDNLYGIKDICSHIIKNYGTENECDLNAKYILVSPDVGGIKRIKAYSNLLKLNYVVLDKQRSYVVNNFIEKSILIGDSTLLNGKIAIIIDDIIDTCGTMISGVNELEQYGIIGAILVATHGILSNPAIEKINCCDKIIKVLVTNTIPINKSNESNKLDIIDISSTLCRTIEILSNGKGESISELFIK